MFKRVTLVFDNESASLEIFAGRDLHDVYAVISDLAHALNLRPAFLRAQQFAETATKLPDLSTWTGTDQDTDYAPYFSLEITD